MFNVPFCKQNWLRLSGGNVNYSTNYKIGWRNPPRARARTELTKKRQSPSSFSLSLSLLLLFPAPRGPSLRHRRRRRRRHLDWRPGFITMHLWERASERMRRLWSKRSLSLSAAPQCTHIIYLPNAAAAAAAAKILITAPWKGPWWANKERNNE